MVRRWIACGVWASLMASVALAAEQAPASPVAADKCATKTEMKATETKVEEARECGNWTIWTPITMRSADPVDAGQLLIKNTYHHSTASHMRDKNAYQFELNYGIAENHEVLFSLRDLSMNKAQEVGNGDVMFGWQWRLWKESEFIPAFALQNLVSIPSGYRSHGTQYTAKGLFTKSIIENKWRVHLNPFLSVACGDQSRSTPGSGWRADELARTGEIDTRHLQWGFVVGTDYRLTDCLDLQFDYIHRSSERTGFRNQHELEAGVGWQLAKNHRLAMATNWTVDGDSLDENWGISFSYIINLDNLPYVKLGS
ncbi:MAG: hypothetical protein FWC56_02070 [Phycisphaerae bacterium]|nr:hypothetical protein [Phycisphaerae bacterium]